LLQLGSRIVVDAEASVAEDARPVTGEEGQIEHPGVAVSVVEGHPLVLCVVEIDVVARHRNLVFIV
jgi:hypothetical protein